MPAPRIKVLYLTNIPAPYRVDFFNELSLYVDLTVLFERESANNRNMTWRHDASRTFRSEFPRGLRLGADGALCPAVAKFVLDRSFDAVVVGGYSTPSSILAILLMKVLRIPYVLNADGGFAKPDGRFLGGIKRWLIGGASAWLSTGRIATEYLVHYGANRERVYTYPFTSIRQDRVADRPRSHIERKEGRRRLGISADALVLSVGSIIPRKGMDTLILAAGLLEPKPEVRIIGGDASDDLAALLCVSQASNVKFEGFKSWSQMLPYFQAADVFVLATRNDIWGLVINEAMSQGVPVVTTDQCGAGLEMVANGESGYIVPPNEPDALATAIRATLASEEARMELAGKALAESRKYTIETMASAHADILTKICARKNP